MRDEKSIVQQAHAYHFMCFWDSEGEALSTFVQGAEEESLLNNNTISLWRRYESKNDNLESKQKFPPYFSRPNMHPFIITRYKPHLKKLFEN
jgi:hypothetical protein